MKNYGGARERNRQHSLDWSGNVTGAMRRSHWSGKRDWLLYGMYRFASKKIKFKPIGC